MTNELGLGIMLCFLSVPIRVGQENQHKHFDMQSAFVEQACNSPIHELRCSCDVFDFGCCSVCMQTRHQAPGLPSPLIAYIPAIFFAQGPALPYCDGGKLLA